MVEITIIMEGGVNEMAVAASVCDNSNALREALFHIFSEALGREDVSIRIAMSTGKRAAAKAFVRETDVVYLYTDLDAARSHRADWFIKMETDNPQKPIVIPEEKRDYVFFMIQEMEAWILKQPDAIERWATINSYQHFVDRGAVSDHRLIAGKDIESLAKPSNVLADIIKQTFQSDRLRKNGKPKGVEYSKLKSASGLLSCLDVSLLVSHDSELQAFCAKVHENLPPVDKRGTE